MNVLHLHTIDVSAGGAKMVLEINRRLNEREGVESHLLVGRKESDSADVSSFGQSSIEYAFKRVVSNYGLEACVGAYNELYRTIHEGRNRSTTEDS